MDLIDPPSSADLKTYKYRWVELFIFCIITGSNQIIWITFSPISDKAEEYWNISSFWVNSLSIIFFLVYILFAFFASWLLDKKGLRFGVIVGAGLTIVGSWVRAAGTWSFGVALFGQGLTAIGQPFLLGAPPKLAAQWFPDKQRTIATTIASLSNPIGTAFGFILPPAFASKSSDIPRMMLFEAIIVSVLCAPAFVFFKEKPPSPPSHSANERKEENIKKSLLSISKNVDMWLLFIEVSLGFGAFNTLATVLNQLLEPYGYSNFDASVLGILVILLGIVGAGVVGAVVDKTKWYKESLLVCLLLATASLLGVTFSLKPNNIALLAFTSSLLGFTMTPTFPVSLELGAEITYPLSEATPSNFLVVGSQIAGVVMIVVTDHWISNGHVRWACYFLVVCVGVALVVMIFFRGKHNRLIHEKEKVDSIPNDAPVAVDLNLEMNK